MIQTRVAIIGYPIEHSLSPIMHHYWLDEMKIENGSSEKILVSPSDLDSMLQELWDKNYQGLNVTIPHKERVFELCSEHTPRALRLRSVNTLLRTSSGWRGDSTDGWGFISSLRDRISLVDFQKKRVVVLGAGGAARSIIDALIEEGFSDILVFNRSQDRAVRLVEEIGSQERGQEIAGEIRAVAMELWSQEMPQTSLLIQTTSMGMEGATAFSCSLEGLREGSVVVDVVYRPLLTPCLSEALRRNCTIIDGLGMLMYQGVAGFEAWFGKRPKVTEFLRQRLIEAMK